MKPDHPVKSPATTLAHSPNFSGIFEADSGTIQLEHLISFKLVKKMHPYRAFEVCEKPNSPNKLVIAPVMIFIMIQSIHLFIKKPNGSTENIMFARWNFATQLSVTMHAFDDLLGQLHLDMYQHLMNRKGNPTLDEAAIQEINDMFEQLNK